MHMMSLDIELEKHACVHIPTGSPAHAVVLSHEGEPCTSAGHMHVKRHVKG